MMIKDEDQAVTRPNFADRSKKVELVNTAINVNLLMVYMSYDILHAIQSIKLSFVVLSTLLDSVRMDLDAILYTTQRKSAPHLQTALDHHHHYRRLMVLHLRRLQSQLLLYLPR